MNLFYAPLIELVQPLVLQEEESAHAIRVLRMKTGDTMRLTDGNGFFFTGEIVSDHPKKCVVRITEKITDPAKRNFQLTLAIAPTKNIDRFEWFLEKATEIGCDEIIPIQCQHSERTVIKTERLNKVLVSALKQCLKSRLPKLHELQDFKKYIATAKNFKGQKFIGHIPELDDTQFPPQNPPAKLLSASLLGTPNSILLTIGPEGGFSEDEVQLAIQNGFQAVSLGNSRLRVETAGVVACSIINSANF